MVVKQVSFSRDVINFDWIVANKICAVLLTVPGSKPTTVRGGKIGNSKIVCNDLAHRVLGEDLAPKICIALLRVARSPSTTAR